MMVKVPFRPGPAGPPNSQLGSPSQFQIQNESRHAVDARINMDEYAYNKIFVGGLHYDTRDGKFLCIYICINECICVHVSMFVYVCIYVYIYVYIYMYIRIYVYVCMHTYMYTYTCVKYICLYMYIYICIYI
jgi:hypothetical protein